MERVEIIEKVFKGEMEKDEAAKLLDLTTTRIGQLVRERAKGAGAGEGAALKAVVMDAEKIVESKFATMGNIVVKKAPMPPTLTMIPGQTGQPSAVPKASSLQDALKIARGGKSEVDKKTGKIKVDAVALTPQEEAEYSEFGKEILTMGREYIVDNIAEYAFDIDPETPELQPVRKGSRLWNMALKQKSGGTAMVGKAADSIWGFLIFGLIECFNVARACRRVDKKTHPEKYAQQPQKASEPVKKEVEQKQVDAGLPIKHDVPKPVEKTKENAPNGAQKFSLKDELNR